MIDATMNGAAKDSPAGRAWLPSSTGFSPERPPTREESREAWMRQARGVFDMTYRARGMAASAGRVLPVISVLLILAGGGLLSGLLTMPPSTHLGLVIALHVIAGLLLLLSQLAGPSLMAADAVAEVTAKSAQAWASSPLSTSAWVAGKVAYYLLGQAMTSLRVLPLAAASALLGGIRLREAVIVIVVGLLWTFVTGMAVAAASLEPRQHLAARLAAKRGGFGGLMGQANPAFRGATPPAAALAVVQVALGIAGLFMAMPFALSGFNLSAVPAPVALIMAALSVASPIGAGASAFFPGFGIEVLGHLVPMWVISCAVAVAWAPLVFATSRLRWRPPDGSLGLGVRPAHALAFAATFSLLFGILRRDPASAAVGVLGVPLLTAFLVALTAGATRLPDLAADALRLRDRVLGLDRRMAGVHALLCLAVTTACVMVLVPARLFQHVPAPLGVLLVAIACVPVALISADVGREGRRAVARFEAGIKERSFRPASVALLVLLLASFLPVVAQVLQGLGIATFPQVLRAFSLLSPLHGLIGLGRDMLGLSLPASPNAAQAGTILGGLAAQFVLAAIVLRLGRRNAALDDPPPPPPPD